MFKTASLTSDRDATRQGFSSLKAKGKTDFIPHIFF
jgi:hypothetical protein